MKKVLNISTVQQALRRLPVAFLIAGSGFLPNASAVRYTIDFQGKAVDPQKCECFFKLLGDYRWYYSSEDYWSSFDSENCKLSIENKKEDDSYDIVFKNGSITKEVSEKFSQNICVESLNSFTFENFKGELNLNPELQSCTKTIRLENCEFTITENCFQYTKNFEPNNSKLLLENGLLSIPEEEEWCGNTSSYIVLPKRAKLANHTTLEAPLSILFNVAVDVLRQLRQCQGTLGYYYGHIKFEELSLIRTENERLRKELESVRKEHKAEIEKLQRELAEEKGKRNTSGDNLRKEIAKAQKAHNDTKEDLKEEKSKVAALLKAVSVAQNEFETAKVEKEKCEKTNADLEERIRSFETKCKSLELNKKNLDFKMKELKASKLKLEAINKKLEADNNALREEIWKSSETVRTAKETLKKSEDLQIQNEWLAKTSDKKSVEIESLREDIKEKKRRIRELESFLGIAGDFINNVHPLLRELKKHDEYIRNALLNAGYDKEVKKFNQSLGKLYEADKERKKQHKSGWIDFNFEERFSVLDDDDNDETYRGNKTIYRGRGNFYGRGCRGRGGYRGNCRGRGCGSKPMINKPRGGKRGGDQRDPFDSDNH